MDITADAESISLNQSMQNTHVSIDINDTK